MTASPDRPQTCLETRVAALDSYVCTRTGALVPQIHPSTTFARDAETYAQIGGRGYTRDENPTYELAERLIADLEGGHEARLFASGMAAIAALVQAHRPGDHMVVARHLYFGTPKLLKDWAIPWGLDITFVDAADPDAVRNAMRPGQTRLVFVESPANPLWTVCDLAALATIAHDAGAILAVDNTVATPVHTQPLALGADIVMHSATKALNGHSDVLAGVLVAREPSDLWDRITHLRYLAGAVLGPFEAWLLARGLRTVFLRVRHQSASALRLAQYLSGHPRVAQVCYPGLPAFPGHAIAVRQMTGGFGSMLSIRVDGGAEDALAVAKRCRLWQRATSLGGVESLIEHRYTIEGPDTPTPPDLLRLSVGIEAVEDLQADLDAALSG